MPSPIGRPHNFGPANDDPDQLVFGACRPGFPNKPVPNADVDAWLDFMESQSVKRVVCLLASSAEFKLYRRLDAGLLGAYERRFGVDNVLHAPIRDYRLSTRENLDLLISFLKASRDSGQRTVVHCAGGSGRTGHTLAAWLVRSAGFDPHDALATVRSTGRNPYEAVERGVSSESALVELLETQFL